MRNLLSVLVLAAASAVSLAAQDAVPTTPPAAQPPAPQPPAVPADGAVKPDRAAIMKEMSDIETQLRPMRVKVMQDPALLKLKADADAATKAARAKEEELLTAQPGYADLKAKREELLQKLMQARGMPPKPKDGAQVAPAGAPVAKPPGQ